MRKINLINIDFGQNNLSINNKSCSSFMILDQFLMCLPMISKTKKHNETLSVANIISDIRSTNKKRFLKSFVHLFRSDCSYVTIFFSNLFLFCILGKTKEWIKNLKILYVCERLWRYSEHFSALFVIIIFNQ